MKAEPQVILVPADKAVVRVPCDIRLGVRFVEIVLAPGESRQIDLPNGPVIVKREDPLEAAGYGWGI